MFTRAERLHDAIYGRKASKAEALRLVEIVASRKKSSGNDLLNVACGTGGHIPHLSGAFRVEGLDLDPKMVDIAGAKHPDVPIHVGDMVGIDRGRRFDAVVSLFSSVGYVRTPDRLALAVALDEEGLMGRGLYIGTWAVEA